MKPESAGNVYGGSHFHTFMVISVAIGWITGDLVTAGITDPSCPFIPWNERAEGRKTGPSESCALVVRLMSSCGFGLVWVGLCVCVYYSPTKAPHGCMGPVPANQTSNANGEHPTSRSESPLGHKALYPKRAWAKPP